MGLGLFIPLFSKHARFRIWPQEFFSFVQYWVKKYNKRALFLSTWETTSNSVSVFQDKVLSNQCSWKLTFTLWSLAIFHSDIMIGKTLSFLDAQSEKRDLIRFWAWTQRVFHSAYWISNLTDSHLKTGSDFLGQRGLGKLLNLKTSFSNVEMRKWKI